MVNRRGVIAAVLGFVYPGLGHVYLRKWVRALSWFVLAIATAVSCFVPKKVCWYVVLFSYAFACGERIVTITDMFRGGEEVPRIVGGFVGVLVGFLFLAALHAEDVRRFYRVGKLTVGKVIAPDLLGFLLGLGLSIGINFLG